MGNSGQSHENRTSEIVGTSQRTSPPTMGSTVDDPSSLVVVVHAKAVDPRPTTCCAPKPGGIIIIVDVAISGGCAVTVNGPIPEKFVITVNVSIPRRVVATLKAPVLFPCSMPEPRSSKLKYLGLKLLKW